MRVARQKVPAFTRLLRLGTGVSFSHTNSPLRQSGGMTRKGWTCAVIVIDVCLASCSKATATRLTSVAPSLAQFVASPLSGFTSEDAIGAPFDTSTGALDYSNAGKEDCNVGLQETGPASWVASELRYFDNNPMYPSVWLAACVSQLKSPSYAKTVAGEDAGVVPVPPIESASIPNVPNAEVFFSSMPNQTNFLVEVIVLKGPYLVVVTTQGNDPSKETAIKAVAVNWAVAEYHRLPT